MTERKMIVRTCDRCGNACELLTSSLELDLTIGATAAWAWVRVGADKLDLCEPCVRGFVRWWTTPHTPSNDAVARPPELRHGQ